jgi:hypothetical protein
MTNRNHADIVALLHERAQYEALAAGRFTPLDRELGLHDEDPATWPARIAEVNATLIQLGYKDEA